MSTPITTHTPRLYELAQDLIEIDVALIESGGELTPEIETQLGRVQGALTEKTEGICKLVRTLETQAEMCESEAKRLTALSHARRNAVAQIKGYVLRWFQVADIQRVDGALFKVWRQANSQPAIRCTVDPSELPLPFKREVVTYDLDREAVKRTPPDELPDCIVVERGEHLRIR